MKYDEIYRSAENYYISGDYIVALGLFQKALTLTQSNDCLNYIGCCYIELMDFDSANEIFKKLIESNPDWERPILNMGRIKLKSGRLIEALKYFKKAVKINPNNEDVYYYLGVYYFKLGDFEIAKSYYNKSLSLNDKQSETHLNLGMCYFRLGVYEKALREFELAYKFDTTCIDAVYNRGLVYIAMGKYIEALNFLIEVSKKESDDIEIMLDISHCYYKLKDLESSLAWVTKVISIDSENKMANKVLKKLRFLKEE